MPLFGFVDCLQQLRKVRGLIDWPQAGEGFTQPFQVTQGEQANGNDAFVWHVVHFQSPTWVKKRAERAKGAKIADYDLDLLQD